MPPDAAPAAATTPAAPTPPPTTPASPPPGTPPPPDPATAADGKPADPPAPPGETQAQKLERLSRAGKAARRAAAENRELRARTAKLEADARAANEQASRQASELTVEQQAKNANERVAKLRELALKDPDRFIAELDAANETSRKANERLDAWERQQQTAQQQAVMQAARMQFFAESADTTAYPNVAKMPEGARLAWAQQVLAEDRARARAQGVDLSTYQPTNKQLLHRMETLAGNSGGPPQAPTVATPAESPAGSKEAPTTVSSSLTSQVHTLPPDPDKMSDVEWKRQMARYLESKGMGKKKRA